MYMDKLFKNSTNLQQMVGYYSVNWDTINTSDIHTNVPGTISKFAPLVIIIAIFLVVIFSPTIIFGNAIILISMYRFKRLRTPSNFLVASLATSDLGIGLFMPIGMFFEMGTHDFSSPCLCLLNYGITISLCCVSILVMMAIAVDRFTSLARPLTYNNLITHTAVERYLMVFWIYSILVGFAPFMYYLSYGSNFSLSGVRHCSFGRFVARPIQLFMFCAVYGPSMFILLICYGYIYVVARSHAKAISVARQFSPTTSSARYGLALAITTGLFLALWLPIQVCMLLDVFLGTNILTHWVVVYLAMPALSNSAFNPLIYAHRNAEFRFAAHKVLLDLMLLLGFKFRPASNRNQILPSIVATAGDQHSFANFKPECYSLKRDENVILVPIAQPESSGIWSESNAYKDKVKRAPSYKLFLKQSRSMNEVFMIGTATDFWVVDGKNIKSINNVSIV